MHAFSLKPYAHNFEIINLYDRRACERSVRRASLSPPLSKLDVHFSTKRSTPDQLNYFKHFTHTRKHTDR